MIDLEPTVVAGALRNLFEHRQQYGRVGWVAHHFGISRPTLYRMEANFREAVCRGPGRRRKTRQDQQIQDLRARVAKLEEHNARLQTQIEHAHQRLRQCMERTAFWLIGLGLPARVIARLLRQCFGVRANRTDILRKAQRYARRATEIMRVYFRPAAQDADLDEIFIENLPLLIASDPRSLAILHTSKEPDLTVPTWSAFLDQMPNLRRATSDRGPAICGAVSRRKDLARQSDIFHPKMLLREELALMEKHCYALIAREDRLRQTLEKTRRRGRDCRAATLRLRNVAEKTRQAIALFDALDAAVRLAFDALRITTADGTFNSPAHARELLDFARLWIHAHLPQGWNKPKRALQDDALLTFLRELHAALPALRVHTATAQDRQFVLVTLSKLWEDQAAQRHRGKPVLIPERIHQQLQNRCSNLAEAQQQLFGLLDQLHRASSGVECINSRVGFYRYSKRRFSTDFANLIAVWHNLTPFDDGKRAARSPAHILGVSLPSHDLFELFAVD